MSVRDFKYLAKDDHQSTGKKSVLHSSVQAVTVFMWPRLCWAVLCHEETAGTVEGFCRSRESILSASPWRMSRLVAGSVYWAKMKCQSRNPNPVARLKLFPTPSFLLLVSFSSCPSRSTKHGIFWTFFFSLLSMLPCLYPHFTPVILLGEIFWIAGSWWWLPSAAKLRENNCGRLIPFWIYFSPILFLGKETNRWLPEWIQRVFCKRVDLSFTYSFLKLSVIHSLLKPRTRCQTKASSRLWEKFLSQLHKCGSGGTPVIKQSIK